MLRFLIILGVIFAVFYFGASFFKRYLNKKMVNLFGASFNQGTKEKKDEVLYKENDVVVLKGEAKNKDEAERNNGK